MSRKRKKTSALKMVFTDVLITALIIGGWFVCWYGSVAIAAKKYEAKAAAATPRPTAEVTAAPETTPNRSEASPEVTETPMPDNRSEWQIKYEEHFTDEVSKTDSSYSSPNVSVTVTKGNFTGEKGDSVYYVADIYIGSIECFQSYFAHNVQYPNRTDLMYRMVEESNAVAAINGDYCGFSFGGIVRRNGTTYINSPNGADICVMYYNGEVKCFTSQEYSSMNLEDESIYQIWTFGPTLMDGSGNGYDENEMDVPYYLAGLNPRTAFGYYEPGHYCFVVVDGRQSGYSAGVGMGELASIMESLGCTQAYNLDGGGSSMMYMNGELANKPSTEGDRDIPDILLITDISAEKGEEQ